MNGSSATGNCFSVTTTFSDGPSRCDAPASSVLFDGNIPTLTGLDGDMWADQLLTLSTTNQVRRDITFDFIATPGFIGVVRVQLVIFNCPERGISVQTVRLLTASSLSGDRSVVGTFNVPNITSCDSLVRICISQNIEQPVIALEFIPSPGSNWTHLAEVTFYGSGSCPPDTITTASPPDTTTPPQPRTTAITTPTTASLIEKDSKHIATWAAAASNVEPHVGFRQIKP